MEEIKCVLWIDEGEQVISFHCKDNFEKRTFNDREEYMTFILIHERIGYKFE